MRHGIRSPAERQAVLGKPIAAPYIAGSVAPPQPFRCMTSFNDLGLRESLVRALEDTDVEHPTALQAATIPVLRRGGNLFARGGVGSGKTLAYGLGVLDRLEPRGEDEEGGGARVLILRPTAEAAERTALALVPLAYAAGAGLAAPGAGWATGVADAEVVVAAPADALAAVRSSELKLDALDALVVDGASDVLALGGAEAVETLLDHTPRDAQRVVFSAAADPAVDDLVERRVKRAVHFPPEPAVPDAQEPPTEGSIGYSVVPDGSRLDALLRLLAAREPGPPPIIFFRTDERAAEVAEALSVRGYLVGASDDPETDVVLASAGATRAELVEASGEEPGATVSFDVPADEDSLRERHGGDAESRVLVAPRELPHLREIARRARLAPHPAPLPGPGTVVNRELEAFRSTLRGAVESEDLAAQMLVLEPLFDEFGAAEIAAAAAALLRRRRAAVAEDAVQPGGAPAQRPQAGPSVGPPPATFARLFVGVGSRDEVRPGDLVGAIAGEANVAGSKIGRIDIRDNFSVVEVHADIAEQVIRAVNGTTIKGRSVRVDYDRGRRAEPGRSSIRRPARQP